MTSEAAQSATWIGSEGNCRVPRAEAGSLIVIMHPIARREERGGGKEGDDQHQDPGERRGIAHAEIGESLLIEIERVEESRAHRAAGALADDEGRGEGL